MNRFNNTIALILITLCFAIFLAGCDTEFDEGSRFVYGAFELQGDEIINGDLGVFGGSATLEEDSIVDGSVILIGGALKAFGEIEGDITSIGGGITLGDTAEVDGDIVTIGAGLKQSDGAVVRGNIINTVPGSYIFNPIKFSWFPRAFVKPSIFVDLAPITNIPGNILKILAISALAGLIILLIPKPVEQIAASIVESPFLAGGLGCLTVLLLPLLVIIMAITIILIPLIPILMILILLAFLIGWIALGWEIGKKMAELFKVQWPPAVTAGLGVLALTLISSLLNWIECIGWIIPFTFAMIGFGGVVISRFGTQTAKSQKTTSPQSQDQHEENVSKTSPAENEMNLEDAQDLKEIPETDLPSGSEDPDE